MGKNRLFKNENHSVWPYRWHYTAKSAFLFLKSLFLRTLVIRNVRRCRVGGDIPTVYGVYGKWHLLMLDALLSDCNI